jgi:lipoate-protein ligase A
MAEARSMTEGTILGHLEKLKAKDPDLDISYLHPEEERFVKIKKAFEKSAEGKLTPVKRSLDDTYTFEELRLARLFLSDIS